MSIKELAIISGINLIGFLLGFVLGKYSNDR